VAFSLLGYFVSTIIVLTAVVGATIGLSNFSTSGGALHYSRPVLERDATVTNNEPRLFMSASEIKDGSPAKNIETNSAAVDAEKADAKKRRPHTRKVLARQRNNYEQPTYRNAIGYAQDTRNEPQRLFSNW